jgi:hypothetical protein
MSQTSRKLDFEGGASFTYFCRSCTCEQERSICTMHIHAALVIVASGLHQTVFAAPKVTVTGWPEAPPAPSSPAAALCGVLLASPACPNGYTCEPIPSTPYCEEIPNDICGSCVPASDPSDPPAESPSPTPLPQPVPGSKSASHVSISTDSCSSGSTLDYRNWCRPTQHSTLHCPSGFVMDSNHYCHPMPTSARNTTSSKFTCPTGFTPDYRGYSYCRPWNPPTTPIVPPKVPIPTCAGSRDLAGICHSTAKAHSTAANGCDGDMDYRGMCCMGTTDYRGICHWATKTKSVESVIEKRFVQTEVVEHDGQ